jgi:hypothetical protein
MKNSSIGSRVRDIKNLTESELASLSDEEILAMEMAASSFPRSSAPFFAKQGSEVRSTLDADGGMHQKSSFHEASVHKSSAVELSHNKFINVLRRSQRGRDYSVLIDASSSMFDGLWEGSISESNLGESSYAENRWAEAQKAVATLAPHVCRCDGDGITLYFFSDGFIKYPNIQSSDVVELLFSLEENQFQGS